MNTDNENNNAPVDGDPSTAGGAADSSSNPVSGVAPTPTVDTLAAERDHLKDQLLRTAADFDNYRKRARREIEDARTRGKDDAIKEVLPVFDNLERAVAAADSAQSVASVVEGVKMVLKLFQDTAERLGLNRVATVGERFDPAIHEAIQQVETEHKPPGTILTEVVPGYLFGQRLLRAAMVVVARKPTKGTTVPPAADGGTASGVSSPPASDSGNGASGAPEAGDGGTTA